MCPRMLPLPLKRVQILRQGWGRFHYGEEVNVVAVDDRSINGLVAFEGGKKTQLAAEGVLWKRVPPIASHETPSSAPLGLQRRLHTPLHQPLHRHCEVDAC